MLGRDSWPVLQIEHHNGLLSYSVTLKARTTHQPECEREDAKYARSTLL